MKKPETLHRTMTFAATLAALGVSVGVPVERALADQGRASVGVTQDKARIGVTQDKARIDARQDKARIGAKQDKARIGATQLKLERPAGAGLKLPALRK